MVRLKTKLFHSIQDIYYSYWADPNMNYPPVKSPGRTVMTSDFVTIVGGVVRYNDNTWNDLKNEESTKAEIKKRGEERVRRAGSILDVSVDGYYNSEKCTADFVKVNGFMTIETQALFRQLYSTFY